MGGVVINTKFWAEQNVFITGHTGFKGSWLSILLSKLGVRDMVGYSLKPPTTPNLFELANISNLFSCNNFADIVNSQEVSNAIQEAKPTIIFHMAAQSLVIESYKTPVSTFATNITGTANILDAARYLDSLKSVVVVTSDKCYENNKSGVPHIESDRLGGHDPYSSSKACAELVTKSMRDSFFNDNNAALIATARAGNVIGGGDWADNRLIPDCYRSFSSSSELILRNPNSVRPWQHVIEPLIGYILLAEQLANRTTNVATAWNFGPNSSSELKTKQVAEIAKNTWGKASVTYDMNSSNFVETELLKLDSQKAHKELSWVPKWSAEEAIQKSILWYKAVHDGACPRVQTEANISEYLA